MHSLACMQIELLTFATDVVLPPPILCLSSDAIICADEKKTPPIFGPENPPKEGGLSSLLSLQCWSLMPRNVRHPTHYRRKDCGKSEME